MTDPVAVVQGLAPDERRDPPVRRALKQARVWIAGLRGRAGRAADHRRRSRVRRDVGRTVHPPPAPTSGAGILASALFGVTGLALADPTTATIKVAPARSAEKTEEAEA